MNARPLARGTSWLALLALAFGCASAKVASPPRPAVSPQEATVVGWKALVEGRHGDASARLAAALEVDPGEPLAIFGLAALADARLDDERALAGYTRLVELAAAGKGGAWAAWLVAAAAGRIDDVLLGHPRPRQAEDRLLAVDPARLAWQARVVLARVNEGILRRRGDLAGLAAFSSRAGCALRASVVGLAGRLPNLDLLREFPAQAARPVEHALEQSGCRLWGAPRADRPGATAVHVWPATTSDRQRIVLGHAGRAALRSLGATGSRGGLQPWHSHGDRLTFGPHWSSTIVPGGPVELRLATYGGIGDLSVYSFPSDTPAAAAPASVTGPLAAASALAGLGVASATGEADRALALATSLAGYPRFALGQAAAAATFAHDPSRAFDVAPERARAALHAALTVDSSLARPLMILADFDRGRERPREALDHARRAWAAAPRSWRAAAGVWRAWQALGIEPEADRALDQALALVTDAAAGCEIRRAALSRARERHDAIAEASLTDDLGRCSALEPAPVERSREHGDLGAVERGLRRRLALGPDADWVRADLASVLLARGRHDAAMQELAELRARAPHDGAMTVRFADALIAAGRRAEARVLVREALAASGTRWDLRRAGRALELAMPFEAFRVDGPAHIAAFRARRRGEDAPAVMVLDRTVVQVLRDGSQVILTHNIVKVQDKEGIQRWGELEIPPGAEVLRLFTHKAGGGVREPEEIAGKETVSLPDLAPGDFVEWETVEYQDTADAFAPGFVLDPFYFQSVETPMRRSELLVVTPADTAIEVDARAGAPTPQVQAGPGGTRVTTFAVDDVPRLVAERGAAPPDRWIPSVRVWGGGASLERWARHLADGFWGLPRASPDLRAAAARIAAGVANDPRARAAAVVRWVTEEIEADGDDLQPATETLARGRGGRTALIVALARALGLDAGLALARAVMTAPGDEAARFPRHEDFAEPLVRFVFEGRPVYVDARLRSAAFGYVPPALHGGLAFVLDTGAFERVRSTEADRRLVELSMSIDRTGAGAAEVTETLTGWPAVECAALARRTAGDERRRRQEFEESWLAHHFPGARLGRLEIDLLGGGDGGARVVYSFDHPHLAEAAGSGWRLAPAFFRTGIGRRDAVEAKRSTILLAGGDVPLTLAARIQLPVGARLTDVGSGGAWRETRDGGFRFEERRTVSAGAGDGPVVHVDRIAELPVRWVLPDEYAAVAAGLRRIDAIEAEELRFTLPAPPPPVDPRGRTR